jgi:nucleoside-diphosphate-sugar epimerase
MRVAIARSTAGCSRTSMPDNLAVTRILVIGGTVFIGPSVVRQLTQSGHQVAVFHRGEHEIDLGPEVRHIHGDRDRIVEHRDAVAAFAPETVVDMRAMTEAQARAVADTVRGIARRLVVVSSMDVYRAYGRLHGSEPGPALEPPFDEDSALREKLYVYREHTPAAIAQRPPWMDEYDKILVERVALGDDALAGSVVRFPMVHGERDGQRRFYPLWKRIADGRRAILMSTGAAAFRSSRTHVENAAHAVALVATDDRAAGRAYNVGEPEALAWSEWARLIGKQMSWGGQLVIRPSNEMPAHLRDSRPDVWDHHLVANTSRIRRELGYREVVDRDEGLRRTLVWYAEVPAADPKTAGNLDYEAEDAALVTIRGAAVH